jgi:oligoribonuclease NrnB/cAMP/cGMP phosphodiesterase (DHH superfamily)
MTDDASPSSTEPDWRIQVNLIIYHGHCADGTMSAAIALDRIGRADLLAATYGDEAPDVTGLHVWILDFSYPRAVLERMKRDAVSLTVLDHHKTAQADLAGLDYAEFDMERSGAGMTWDHFHPHQALPVAVRHIQDRDLWKFDYPATRRFCAAYANEMETLEDPDEKVRATALLLHLTEDSDQYLAMVEEGRLMEEQFGALVSNIAKQCYPIDLLGERFMAVNAPGVFASELGNHLSLQYQLPSAVWYSDGEQVKVSLRSLDHLTDVSAIATAFGGGGHRNAAGFRAGLTFMREVGVKLEANTPDTTLESAGLPGIRVWDVKDGDLPPV